jgi:beta-glucuronidase
LLIVGVAVLIGLLAGCQPAARHQATLSPTLSLRGSGVPIAYQNGIPVPSFTVQPRPMIALDGSWRVQPTVLNTDLTLGDRAHTLPAIRREADGRQGTRYDDSSWQTLAVPGSLDSPPGQHASGAWYRRTFEAPDLWNGLQATLKFAAARYVADVWLNGTYLGYHEGGSTPFAFDASRALNVGGTNTLAVRVDNPTWGTRNDILPWGLADWWNYGGLVGSVWLEGTDPLSLVRADVVPHLDGADVSVVAGNASGHDRSATLTVELLPAALTDQNLLDPRAASLVAPGAKPIATRTLDLGQLASGEVRRVPMSFLLRGVDLWGPGHPALYVVHAVLHEGDVLTDEMYESFGLRQIAVDNTFPRLLLNGFPIAFRGVAVHDERQQPAVSGRPLGGPMTEPAEFLDQLHRVQQVHADLVRADHHPPSSWLPLLADRLGIAVWEEIPFYHYTPQTFDILMGRGIAQQMLVEMALRDFDRPSVLFHGLSNESTGGQERESVMAQLRDLDRKVDGTRLVGQASYGSDPTDQTSTPLDVVGFTFYWGVFYGGPLSTQQVAQELARAHQASPRKPIMILEFGHWADTPQEEAYQAQVFNLTYGGIAPWFDDVPGGYVGSVVWWALDDYWTQRPGIQVEHFGLYRPDGSTRPVAGDLAAAYAQAVPPAAGVRPIPGGAEAAVPVTAGTPSSHFLGPLVYAIALPAVLLLALAWALTRPPRRARWSAR